MVRKYMKLVMAGVALSFALPGLQAQLTPQEVNVLALMSGCSSRGDAKALSQCIMAHKDTARRVVNCQNLFTGTTVLHVAADYAVKHGSADACYRMLRLIGAREDINNKVGYTPRMIFDGTSLESNNFDTVSLRSSVRSAPSCMGNHGGQEAGISACQKYAALACGVVAMAITAYLNS